MVPYPEWTPVEGLERLTPSESAAVAATLPVTPYYVVPYAGLRRGLDRAFFSGSRSNPEAIILQHPSDPAEPEYLGRNVEAGWSVLSRIPGWFCLNGSTDEMNLFAEIFSREIPHPFHRLGDLFFTLETPPKSQPNAAVRRLRLPDLPLVQRYPGNVWGNSYRTFDELLTDGVVTGAFADDRLVSVAILSADNGRYADVGVHTLEAYRRRGLSAEAAALVAEEARARGLIPIWSTGSHNLASQRVAEKLGFRRYGQCEYLVFDALRGANGYRPIQGRNTHAAMHTP